MRFSLANGRVIHSQGKQLTGSGGESIGGSPCRDFGGISGKLDAHL